VDHPLELAPEAGRAFELVAPRGDGFVLRAAPGMSIERVAPGLAERAIGPEVALAVGDRFRVLAGRCTFLVSVVPAPRRHRAPLIPAWERSVVVAAGLSLAVHLGLLAVVDSIAPDARALNDDPFGGEGRLTLVRMQPPEDRAPEPEIAAEGGASEGAAGQAGTRMALTEGRMGDRAAEAPDGRYQIEDRKERPALAREQAIERARQAGPLGVLQRSPQMFASLTGTADLSSGMDPVDIYGGLIGDEARAMAGGWGGGIRDIGPGGGGAGWGTIGTTDLGGFGWGGSCGSGRPPTCAAGLMGHGTGTGTALPRRKTSAPTVQITSASTVGDLDPNTIRRHIRRKLPAIRHCYERALVARQDLSGTVLVQFQISPQGVVQGTVAGGMGEGNVDGCVAEAIQSIQFPRPRGGGMVNVRYPFVFQPAG
jgi:TonB family protein